MPNALSSVASGCNILESAPQSGSRGNYEIERNRLSARFRNVIARLLGGGVRSVAASAARGRRRRQL
jgi:hypothetical protein